jgi:hypothetical protein
MNAKGSPIFGRLGRYTTGDSFFTECHDHSANLKCIRNSLASVTVKRQNCQIVRRSGADHPRVRRIS